MQLPNQITRIFFLVTIAAVALPATATPQSGPAKSANNTTILDTLDGPAPAGAPQQYQTMRSLGLVKVRPAPKPVDPNHPTWQNYKDAASTAQYAGNIDKARKYQQAALVTMEKSIQANPTQKLSARDSRLAKIMCIHQMCVDGTAIVKSGEKLGQLSDAKDLQKLVDQQDQQFASMRAAHATLSKLAPKEGHGLSFELTKCTEVMARSKDRLEKAQSEAMSNTKTQ